MVVGWPVRDVEVAEQEAGAFMEGLVGQRKSLRMGITTEGLEKNDMAGGKEQGLQSQAALGSSRAQCLLACYPG